MNVLSQERSLSEPFYSLLSGITSFLPRLSLGIIVLVVGLFIAHIIKRTVISFISLLQINKLLKAKTKEQKKIISLWSNFLAELSYWTVTILFLVPAVDIWGIPGLSQLLNKLLAYIPNVFIAAIIGLIGAVVAHFTADIVRHGGVALGAKSTIMANVSYYAIVIFTSLIILNQLGIASYFIRILFTGFVAMFAIAGGLAFGLGGQDVARDILESIRKKLK